MPRRAYPWNMAPSGRDPASSSERPTGERAPSASPPLRERDESTVERLLRHARLYTWAASVVALLIVLILLISVNGRTVKIDWVVGSTRASLVWIVLAATVLGWLLGIATSVFFRHRTRRRELH